VNGAVYEWTFTEAKVAIEVANDGTNLCGARSYKVYMPNGSTEVTGDWITITETPSGSGTYKLKASPIADALVTGSVTSLKLKTKLTSHSSHAGITETLAVTVTAATCNCELLTWDNPAAAATLSLGVAASSSNTVTIPEATINNASKIATPAIRVCATVPANVCALTYTSSLVKKGTAALPSFMSVSGTTLTVLPTLASHIGVFTLTLTQTTASGANPVHDAVVVTVTCTLTAVANPTNPATQTYNIYQPTMTIDLATLGVAWTQTPPCALTVTESLVWTIPGAATSITEVSGNKMQLKVVSNKATEAGDFVVKLVNSIGLTA